MEFQSFEKIARLSRGCVITEKIDGTNAQITIVENGDAGHPKATYCTPEFAMYAGSRNRWIVPGDDNYGFAKWVWENREDLLTLGLGSHFGEWWGSGIQRGYGLEKGEKRFSLFNTSRWHPENPPPACCYVVPVIYTGIFTSTAVDDAVTYLRDGGSKASPGFMRPEGVVVYQSAGRCYFKKTLEKDEAPKGNKVKEPSE